MRAASTPTRIHGNRSQASARRRWPASRAASTACSSRPTSPRAASTSRRSATSSTSTCRGARRLHPPRRPHRPRRGDRRRVHVRRSRGGSRHAAIERRFAGRSARDAARLRLPSSGSAARDPTRRADRGNPRAAGGRAATGAEAGSGRSWHDSSRARAGGACTPRQAACGASSCTTSSLSSAPNAATLSATSRTSSSPPG